MNDRKKLYLSTPSRIENKNKLVVLLAIAIFLSNILTKYYFIFKFLCLDFGLVVLVRHGKFVWACVFFHFGLRFNF